MQSASLGRSCRVHRIHKRTRQSCHSETMRWLNILAGDWTARLWEPRPVSRSANRSQAMWVACAARRSALTAGTSSRHHGTRLCEELQWPAGFQLGGARLADRADVGAACPGLRMPGRPNELTRDEMRLAGYPDRCRALGGWVSVRMSLGRWLDWSCNFSPPLGRFQPQKNLQLSLIPLHFVRPVTPKVRHFNQ
jgi:hypothetical protein